MKKICFFILSIVFASHTYASHVFAKSDTLKNPTVPKEIIASFSKTHPNAKLANWTKSNGIYIVSYREENSNLWTTFNSTGQLMENKWKIDMTDLPPAALEYIQKNNKESVQDYYKIIDANGSVNYEVSSPNKSYVFHSNGDLFKTVELLKK